MKTRSSIMALIVLLLLISIESFAAVQRPVVSAPVDGGLLALLAGAGIAWFVVRKRNSNKAD